MNKIRCMINDVRYEIEGVPPTMSLLHYLRDVLHLTGTKEGCNEGDCGACTVIFRDDTGKEPRYRAVNSCLIYLPMLHGKRFYTIEGLEQDGKRHPVQEAIMRNYASQCGYCTPGIAMSLFEATYRHDMTKPWQFTEQMAGNLCRCTGYRPINECVHQLAGTGHDDHFTEALKEPADEIETLDYVYEDLEFYVPVTLAEAIEFKAAHPEATMVSGASDVGVIINHKIGAPRKCFMSLCNIRELRDMYETETGVHIGATTRLAEVELFCEDRLPPFSRTLRYFAAHQIKQLACIAGSISGASPVGDMAPILTALDADVQIVSKNGVRKTKMGDFIQGYRKTSMTPDEFVIGFDIPRIPDHVRCASYKISKRQELDISSCSACFYIDTDENNNVTVARLSYGGMAAIAGARALKTEAFLIGKPWNEETVEAAAALIHEDFKPLSDFRASAWYRITVAANLFRGFYMETLTDFHPHRMYRPTSTIQLGV
ncbi:MAG: FAD binding domain-containing protein [Proteobacteria bacterium]|nr:FAD binding domain-containing protein [Pseudomonadota bacterium]